MLSTFSQVTGTNQRAIIFMDICIVPFFCSKSFQIERKKKARHPQKRPFFFFFRGRGSFCVCELTCCTGAFHRNLHDTHLSLNTRDHPTSTSSSSSSNFENCGDCTAWWQWRTSCGPKGEVWSCGVVWWGLCRTTSSSKYHFSFLLKRFLAFWVKWLAQVYLLFLTYWHSWGAFFEK